MGTYLDKTGLQKVWEKVKAHDTSTLTAAKNYTDGLQTKLTDGTITVKVATNASNDGNGKNIANTYATIEALEQAIANCESAAEQYVDDQLGVANGIATLDSNGKVPAAQLPSYVDDILEGYIGNQGATFYKDSAKTTSYTGEGGKIYVDVESGRTYRWSGSSYVEISSSLALGLTSSTAYSGAKGKANADNIAILQGYFTDGVANNAKNANYATNAGGATNANSALNDSDGNKIVDTYAKKTDIPTSLPASDVSAWAKAATKPTYTWSEITSKPTWIGSTKPTYTYTEVGAASSSHNHDTVYIKKTDTIDAEKIYIDENADWQYIEQPQGFGDFLVKTDAGLAAINNSVNSITALTEADINEVCV